MLYTPIEREVTVLCDNGDPTAYLHPLYRGAVFPYTEQSEFICHQCSMLNNSGSSAVMGVGVRKSRERWKAGQLTAAGVFTDQTAAAQNLTANDVTLETLTANDGFVVLCFEKFDLIDLFIGTAGVGAGTVHDFAYTKGDGTWIIPTIGNLPIPPPNAAGANWAAGEVLVNWDVFPDWGLSTGAEATNFPAGMYAIRIRATTPPTTAALANSLTVHMMTYDRQTVATGTNLLVLPVSEFGVSLGYGEAVSCFFSVASGKNRIEGEFRKRG